MTNDPTQLKADWFDAMLYEGCLAMSVVLPDYVPLRSNIQIRIVEEFFANRPLGVAGIDHSWMSFPYPIMTKWTHVAWPIHPWIEDFSIARDLLRNTGIGSVGATDTMSVSDTPSGHQRSVVLLILPVKQLGPAIQSRDDKVSAIALVHWVLAEWLRAVRMGGRASLPDLTILRMPVAIPVRYAKVVDGELHWSDEEYNIFPEDLLQRTLPQPVVPKEWVARIGEAFGNLTAGRLSAVILDHILRGDAAAKAGDDVGALLAYSTACEVAIVNLTLALRWEDGDNASYVSRELRETSVTKMVNSLCHSLGGQWSVDKAGPARSWFVNVALVRNQAIHAGHLPTQKEVEGARKALGELMIHIAKRLIVKWKQREKTLALFVSRGSVDLFASKKSHSKIVAKIESLALPSEEAFGIWRHDYETTS